MKKIMMVSFILCLLLTSCNRTYSYCCYQPRENISAITYVSDGFEAKVPEDEYHALLDEIQALPCRKFWNDPVVTHIKPYIIIEYKDGSIEEISSQFSCYRSNGDFETEWYYFDRDAFAEIMNRYYDLMSMPDGL